jgi:hypothetical protein
MAMNLDTVSQDGLIVSRDLFNRAQPPRAMAKTVLVQLTGSD